MIEVNKINDVLYQATCPPLAEYGYGNTPEIAINNLTIKMENYKDALLQRKDRLSVALQSELIYLEKHF